jgi:predicted transcriptional regulator
MIGSLNERVLLDRVFRNPDSLGEEVALAMQPPLAAVELGDTVDQVFSDLRDQRQAVVVARHGRPEAVLTRSDLLEYLAHRR